MSMVFTTNTSPFFGKEGKHVTSQKIRERLYKELEKNLALRVEDTEAPEKFQRIWSWYFALECIDRNHAQRRL
jgi:predicted membrane GTPase involved in stress response